MNDDIKEELQAAVFQGDLVQVKALLAAGADINTRLGLYENTALHLAHKVDVVEELLFHGPNVNARNNYGWAPLHCALEFRKGVEVIGEIVKREADSPSKPNDSKTVLIIHFFNRYNDLEIVRKLLEYGADINITCFKHPSEDNHFCTPLDMCVVEGDVQCSKLFIKIALLRNFDDDYKKVISLDNYTEFEHYKELLRYLNECVKEILLMRKFKVNNNHSLYQYIKTKTECIKPLYATIEISDHDITTNYPIYQDIILPKIKLCVERANLYDKLPGIYMRASFRGNSEEKDVILNADCKYKIAEYLTNDDLSNLVAAFEKSLVLL